MPPKTRRTKLYRPCQILEHAHGTLQGDWKLSLQLNFGIVLKDRTQGVANSEHLKHFISAASARQTMSAFVDKSKFLRFFMSMTLAHVPKTKKMMHCTTQVSTLHVGFMKKAKQKMQCTSSVLAQAALTVCRAAPAISANKHTGTERPWPARFSRSRFISYPITPKVLTMCLLPTLALHDGPLPVRFS